MFAGSDECKNFRNCGILGGHRPGGVEALGKSAGSMKQLLIERAQRGKPLARELAPLQADDVEAFEHGVLAVDEAERNDVAAHAADAADHHLRSDPGELMHGGQAADENKIADLAMAAQGSGGRKDHIVANLAVMTDMATVHEVAAVANPGNAAAGGCPGV